MRPYNSGAGPAWRLTAGWPGRVAALAAFGVYAFIYPIGIALLVFGWLPPGAGWVGGALLIAQGIAVAAWFGLNFGWARALATAALIAGGAWALEATGVTTGRPFGAYHYTPELGAWLGPVPLAIPLAWVASVGAAYFTARRLLPAAWRAGWRPVILGAALATAQDAVLETVATRVQGYWGWDEAGAAYYGVPWANFATWFVAALALGAGAQLLLRPADRAPLRYPWLPGVLYAMSLIMFGILNGSRGYLIPAALAALLLVVLIWRLR
jgi:uncharacterized membrane protein